jgi:hypothetical protein
VPKGAQPSTERTCTMRYLAHRLKNGLLLLGLALAAVVGFALFAVLAVAMRPLLMLGLVLVLLVGRN